MNLNSIKRISVTTLLICFASITTIVHGALETKVGNFFVYPGSNASTILDILIDASYDCNRPDLVVKIISQPTQGTVTVQADKTVIFKSKSTTGNNLYNDSFTYTLTCDGVTSPVTRVYIYAGYKPDNMIDNICHIAPDGFAWKIGEPQKSTISDVVVCRPWVIGDLDGNGLPEIIAHADYTSGSLPDIYADGGIEQHQKVVIFKDGNLKNHKYIDLKSVVNNQGNKEINPTIAEYYAISAIGVSKFDDDEGAIVTAAVDGYLYAYEYSADDPIKLRWSSDQKYDQAFPHITNASYLGKGKDRRRSGASIAFADFDGDGEIEVYIGNKIYSLNGLKLLTKLDNGVTTANMGKSIQNSPNVFSEYGGCISIAADLDGDGLPELIVGNEAYKVNRSGNNWSLSLYKKITPPTLSIFGVNTTISNDGWTSVADLNGDGYLDVVVSKIGYVPITVSGVATRRPYLAIYGWDVRNNKILFRTVIQDRSNLSYPMIGDMDGDGKLEIAFTQMLSNTTHNGSGVYSAQGRGQSYLKGYKLPTTFGPSASLVEKWSLQIDETYARTGISLFDFNLDGKMELIYRDMDKLRIMQANNSSSTFADLATISSTSATTFEMAIVADIDNDGAAEIICASGQGTNNAVHGKMETFKSGNTYNWAPARSVWNQYAYNPTFVNEDLTTPKRLMNPATGFTDDYGTKRYPFNNMLQQVPIMNMEGITLNAAANLLVDPASTVRLAYDDDTDELTVHSVILNDGNIPFRGQIVLQLYAYTDATNKYTAIGPEYKYGNSGDVLNQYSNVSMSYKVPNFTTLMSSIVPNRWYLAINTKKNGTNAPLPYYGQEECKPGDNMTYRISFVQKEMVICEGESSIIELPDIYSYRWFKKKSDTTPLTTVAGADNKLSFTKNSDPVEYVFVETYRKGDYVRPLTSIRDTVYIYKTPSELVWNGKGGTGDWHNFQNWRNPNDPANLYPHANIPRSCTNVTIPDGVSRYPALVEASTSYKDYANPECNIITINHGGEVSLPTRLHYNKAQVDIAMSVNRWYMFSPPLKDFYTGDIYIKDPNPFLDDAIMSVRKFGLKNPQNGYVSAGWTGKFRSPDVTFKAGEGLAIWLNDGNTNAANRTKYSFQYPKFDANHYGYHDQSHTAVETYPIASRANANRFIFDGLPNASNNFTVATLDDAGQGLSAKKLWLIGNPFMSHLDFDKFYQANKTKIKNYYRIMTDGGQYNYYNSGANTLPKYIAPMQAFIVEIADGVSSVTSLTFNGSMTVNVPGSANKIRSASDNNATKDGKLTITFYDEESDNDSKIFILAEESASNAFDESDVSLLLNTYTDFTIEPSVLFTESTDNQYLSVNRVNSKQLDQLDIPLGIRSVKANQKITFSIQGQSTFADNLSLTLLDKLENKRYDIMGRTWFYFKNDIAQEFLTDRFIIEVGEREGLGIEDNPIDDNKSISVTSDKGMINIFSGKDLIKSVQIFDLQGKTIKNSENITSMAYSANVSYNGVYIVKITTDNTIISQKVIVN